MKRRPLTEAEKVRMGRGLAHRPKRQFTRAEAERYMDLRDGGMDMDRALRTVRRFA